VADNTQLNKASSAGDIIASDAIVDGAGQTIKHQRVKMQYGDDGSATDVSKANPLPVTDPWLQHAIDTIASNYGDTVSVFQKNKDLLKFGRNRLVGTSKAVIMTLPSGILNETYPTTNSITTISSSSAADTNVMRVEGHTVDVTGLIFTFVVQTPTLNGQGQVTLATPLARVSRTNTSGAVDTVGNIYVYETDTTTAGVPDTNTKVHLIQEAGANNSEKAATTISDADYYIVTGFYGDVLEKSASFATLHLEVREAGGVFINKVDVATTTGGGGRVHEFKPYLVVPKNADVRLRASADGANTDISGGIQGVLASVV